MILARRRSAAIRMGAAVGLLLGSTLFAAAQDDKVVATINGSPITQSELAATAGDLDQQFQQLPPEQRQAAALSALIEIKLLAEKAEKEGLDKDPEVMQRLALLRLRVLHQALIDKEVASKIDDAALHARYDKEIAAMPPVNEVHARHILVKTKEEAEAIIKQLEAGADFQKLANEHTTDPSGKQSGGDLGWFGPGQMVPEFEKAAMALPVGSYTKEPVQTQFGWHVIKVEDKRVQQPPPFEQVKDQIRQVLLREGYFNLVKSLRGEAKIEITDPALKAGVEAIEKPEAAQAPQAAQPAAGDAPAAQPQDETKPQQ